MFDFSCCRAKHATVAIKDKIYVFGGQQERGFDSWMMDVCVIDVGECKLYTLK